MINNTKTLQFTGLTAIEAATVRKEVGESVFLFDCKIEKENAETYKAVIAGVEDELATLSLPAQQTATATPDPTVEAVLVDEDEGLSLSDVKSLAVDGAVGLSKIASRTAGATAAALGSAAAQAAVVGGNSLVRSGKSVYRDLRDSKDTAEMKQNLVDGWSALKALGRYASKKAKNAIKD